MLAGWLDEWQAGQVVAWLAGSLWTNHKKTQPGPAKFSLFPECIAPLGRDAPTLAAWRLHFLACGIFPNGPKLRERSAAAVLLERRQLAAIIGLATGSLRLSSLSDEDKIRQGKSWTPYCLVSSMFIQK